MKGKHLPCFVLLLTVLATYPTPHPASAQQIDLEYCLRQADSISLLRQQDYHYETIRALSGQNIGTGWYPKVSLAAQASYQSDVFSFPENPLFGTPIIPKDQYRMALEFNQPIYDGGMIRNRKAAESARISAEQSATHVELYSVRTSVSRLYFAVLVLEANLEILRATREELSEQRTVIDAGIRHGVLLPASSSQFQKTILGVEQQMLEARLDRIALLELLGKWTGQTISPAAAIVEPIDLAELPNALNRPEFRVFDRQIDYYEALKGLGAVPHRPQLAIFAQAGYGQPNPLNFLDTEFSNFYMAGIRLQWNLLSYGQLRREQDMHTAHQLITASRRQLYSDELERKLVQQRAEIEKLVALLHKDDELIALQRDISGTAYAQLQNGTIQSADYLSERTELTRLEISRELHRIRLLEARYRWLDITGNL